MAARQIALGVLVLSLSTSPVLAQASRVGEGDGVFKMWESKEDLFGANFPGDPVRTTITWETEYGAKIPGRVYTATLPGPRTYSVTVVNYGPVQQILTDSVKSCIPGDERCEGTTSFPGAGYWKNDVRGAMIYAAAKYLKRDITLGHYAWSFMGGQAVENNELQFVNNKDKSRTFVNIFMHHNLLYIMEETAPANYPPPGLFVQSMALKESDGSGARHYGVYFNGATIDPVEARTCSAGGGNRGGGPGNGPPTAGNAPPVDRCATLPEAVRFLQMGPAPAAPAGAQAPGAATPGNDR